MILKGSQRGGGRDLAIHLMRADDNEHVRVHELRGFATDNLKDALKEAEAISAASSCSIMRARSIRCRACSISKSRT